MSHRPYPSIERALHQVERHVDQVQPQALRGYESGTAAGAFERWAAAMRAAAPPAQQLMTAWSAARKPRPAGGEEKTG